MSQKNLPDGYSIFEKPGSMVLRNETKWITAFETNIAGTIFFVGLFVVSGIFFSRLYPSIFVLTREHPII